MSDLEFIRAAALTLLRDISAGRAQTAVPESDRLAAMNYVLDEGWIDVMGEITPAGRAALADP